MFNKFVVSIAILWQIPSSSLTTSNYTKSKPHPTPFTDWDFLLFSQRWPVTSCEQWQQKSSDHKCDLPPNRAQWTVHGIWPTKIGTEGPAFCKSALHFDVDQLQPILDDLNTHWTNVEDGTKPDSFWRHEWDKHGTCAVTLPQLNSVTNFFRRGLTWNGQYDVAKMLAAKQIVPNVDGYGVDVIFDAVQASIGTRPMIECVVDPTTKQSLISEIHICFNKSLDLIDCDVKNNGTRGAVFSNCSLKKPVMYYGSVPTMHGTDVDDNFEASFLEECLENYQYRERLLNFYYLVKFLIWFTL